jgi:L-malate glycosyltransferase
MLEIAAHSAACGRRVHVIAIDGQGVAAVREACASQAIAFTALGTHRSPIGLRAELHRELRRLTPSVIHTHNYKPNILLAGIPRTSPHERRISTCHNWLGNTWRVRFWERLDLLVLRGFDHVTAVSTAVREKLVAHGIDARRVTLIRNGLDLREQGNNDKQELRRALLIEPDWPVLIQVGRLDDLKGVDTLLHALALLPPPDNLQLLLAGDGPERQALEQLSIRLGLTAHVRFLGFRTDVRELLAAADMLVLASHLEGTPMIVLEAMASGCPMILTTVGEIPNMLESDNAAWLVPPRNAAALAGAVRESLANPHLASQRAAIARALHAKSFSRAAMGQHYESLYDSISAD